MVSTRTLKVVAWTAAGLISTVATVSILLEILGPGAPGAQLDPIASSGGVPLVTIQAVVSAAFGALGAIIASRQPRNPVGWLLIVIGAGFVSIGIGNELYLQVVLPTGNVSGVAAHVLWATNWAWIPAMVPAFTLLPLLFPTGRLLSPRWRAIVWIVVVGAALAAAGSAFQAGPLSGATAVINPLGIDSPAVMIAGAAGLACLVPAAIVSIASLVIRFRRSSGVERQQLKWVVAAAALLPIAPLSGGLIGDDSWPLILIALLIVAGAVAVAMLRYRLYDIDLVINKTLVYVALTATLAAAYVGGVLVLQFGLRPLTERSQLAVAGSTLAVAALFRPARTRIQAAVDRRFFRSRFDASLILGAFSGRLREQLDLPALEADLSTVVAQTVQPAHMSLWLRDRS